MERQLQLAGDNASQLQAFLKSASEQHGESGARAARFLVENMPPRDLKSLQAPFLLENLALAIKARDTFPWAKTVPEEIYFNDVLPYASLDETREPWRAEFYEIASQIVKDATTATEAAQLLNRDFFNRIDVHYNTGRKRPNQSPSESRKLKMATCTGLSIILVDACRAVGVPARVAGIALWPSKTGNHTWVEVWDGRWFYTGADEYDKAGLDKGWFTKDASGAVASDWRHAIWATSWKQTGSHFPMVWALNDTTVPGLNVTDRYAKPEVAADRGVAVHVRVFDTAGGSRVVASVELLNDKGATETRVQTRAGTADMNDMPAIHVPPGAERTLRVTVGGVSKIAKLKVDRETTLDLAWTALDVEPADAAIEQIKAWLALAPEERHLSVPDRALNKDQANAAAEMIFAKLAEEARTDRKAELDRVDASRAPQKQPDPPVMRGTFKIGDKEMKILQRTFGDAPKSGRSLWISLHGGGEAPERINTQQWLNQIGLYKPAEGIYVAPRAPTDKWNMWFQDHMDDFYDRLIENYILSDGIDPNRVYLLGYSAGGDGVYQIAPRFADRLAAASMMAGHPNDASPLGLRNLPFMIWCGALDKAHNRNKVAAEWGVKLDELAKQDPGAYVHETHIIEGKGHWMSLLDAAALPWMQKHTRDPWPKAVVWHQSHRTHGRFYWLEVPIETAAKNQLIRAKVEGQKISLESTDVSRIRLRLSDSLLDLDKPITVDFNGKVVYEGKVSRSAGAVWHSLQQRLDPTSVATALLDVSSKP